MVGPNEAGKTAVLQALQKINRPSGVDGFDPLRDFPRSSYNDISTRQVDPAQITVVEAHFALDPEDQKEIPEEYKACTFVRGTRLDNSVWHELVNGPDTPTYKDIKKDLARLISHVDARMPKPLEGEPEKQKASDEITNLTSQWDDSDAIDSAKGKQLKSWLDKVLTHVDESDAKEEARHETLVRQATLCDRKQATITKLSARVPVFVLFNNYFRTRPLVHLEHLANRIDSNTLDDKAYDYGNQCLLKLLGFSARDLSNLGKAAEPGQNNPDALKTYRDQLDKRSYQLNAASVRLSQHIREVWVPDLAKQEADKLHIRADSQYLKVVVEDDLGVEIELDQRSEGYQWLVSFFVVFFAEAAGKHKNAVLLLDEPGMSLHGLKQREFRNTISKLAKNNQTIYTTHSPFLVGPDELDLVRVVEMVSRSVGTKVHTVLKSGDSVALLPLQEVLGYDLAQSLFAQQRNLVLEGLTDYWYLDSVAQLLGDAKIITLNDKIALIHAGSAGKLVYYATILHAHKLKVAALLDSDTAGDQAAKQDELVNALGNKKILRTKDFYSGIVAGVEIEDLLRDTLVTVAKSECGWDVAAQASAQAKRPIVDLMASAIADFSKYKLAKAFIRWSRSHSASDLQAIEREHWKALILQINKSLA